MRFLRSCMVLAALAASAPALAQNPFSFVNCQQLQVPATCADFNNLVNTLDTFFGPRFPQAQPPGSTATSGISLTQGTATTSPSIQTYSIDGSQTNVSLAINPLGNGNIVLFSGGSPVETGLIQIANSASWVPIQGIASCPGVPAGKAPIGMADHVTGYFMIVDWASRTHGIATC